jgi:hypothetical protein
MKMSSHRSQGNDHSRRNMTDVKQALVAEVDGFLVEHLLGDHFQCD